MKLALIPPIPNLYELGQVTDMHMCLAHLFKDNRYTDYYTARALEGDFIILDNGAHEGPAVSLANLLVKGSYIHASEIVIPDAPHDTVNTVALFDQTLKLMMDVEWLGLWEASGSPRFMFVPQVPLNEEQGFEKFLDLARYMFSEAVMYPKPLKFTMGVPLMYDALPGGIYSLIDRLTWLVEDTDVEIHLLGWSRDFHTPVDIAKDYPSVRSCDTAKPFVFAREGIDLTRLTLNSSDTPEYPGRPDDYFETPLTPEAVQVARANAEFCRDILENGYMQSMPQQGTDLRTTPRSDEVSDRT